MKARTCTQSEGAGQCVKAMMGPKVYRAQLCFLSDVKQFKLLFPSAAFFGHILGVVTSSTCKKCK